MSLFKRGFHPFPKAELLPPIEEVCSSDDWEEVDLGFESDELVEVEVNEVAVQPTVSQETLAVLSAIANAEPYVNKRYRLIARLEKFYVSENMKNEIDALYQEHGPNWWKHSLTNFEKYMEAFPKFEPEFAPYGSYIAKEWRILLEQAAKVDTTVWQQKEYANVMARERNEFKGAMEQLIQECRALHIKYRTDTDRLRDENEQLRLAGAEYGNEEIVALQQQVKELQGYKVKVERVLDNQIQKWIPTDANDPWGKRNQNYADAYRGLKLALDSEMPVISNPEALRKFEELSKGTGHSS